MVLAVPSWRSWCCSLPVCLHGLCRGAIPARERQHEHGRGSTSTAPGHWAGTVRVGMPGGLYWAILLWGAAGTGGELKGRGHSLGDTRQKPQLGG